MENEITRLTSRISWVGYIDWTIRDFHSYMTSRGSSYNAYLIEDDKNVLIDTVKKPYGNYLLNQLTEKLGAKKLDYIVVNHAEPDHSGAMQEVIKSHPDAEILCTAKCEKILSHYYDTSGWKFLNVKTGDTINVGKHTLEFIETPMVHWPESMFTYIPEAGILFSMDAFGQHYASSNHFDDQVNLDEVLNEAKKYYANIVMLYGKQIRNTLQKTKDLDIKVIAPAHGVIWRSNLGLILKKYEQWTEFKAKPKVLVIYDSMWESTKMMAKAIVKGASFGGVEAKLLFVRATGLTDIATDVLDCAGLAFGSATLNRRMMPMMSATLTYLKGLRPSRKAGFAFGSTGWGKGGTEDIMESLNDMDIDIIREPIKTKWRPDREILQECEKAGRALAERALEISKQ
jgi:flavorubredoxin